MAHSCAVLNCMNSSRTGHTMFRLPREGRHIHRNLWLQIPLKNIKIKYARFCEIHFRPSDIEIKKQLTKTAYPSLHLYRPPTPSATNKVNQTSSSNFSSSIEKVIVTKKEHDEEQTSPLSASENNSSDPHKKEHFIIDNGVFADAGDNGNVDDNLNPDSNNGIDVNEYYEIHDNDCSDGYDVEDNVSDDVTYLPIDKNEKINSSNPMNLYENLNSKIDNMIKENLDHDPLLEMGKKLIELKQENEMLKKNLKRIFNDDQIQNLVENKLNSNAKVICWDDETVEKCRQTRILCGYSGYHLLLNQGFPLPKFLLDNPYIKFDDRRNF